MSDQIDRTAEARAATVELVGAYLSNQSNRVAVDEVPAFIKSCFDSIMGLTGPETLKSVEPQATDVKTRLQIKASITPTHLISFLDNKPYRSMKRHLTTSGMTPRAYRTRFGLPDDYPITHPDYSAKRSELAKAIGLGVGGHASRVSKTALAKTKKATDSA